MRRGARGGGSARILAELARSNVLIAGLDRGGTTYRYHPMFARCCVANCAGSTPRASRASRSRERLARGARRTRLRDPPRGRRRRRRTCGRADVAPWEHLHPAGRQRRACGLAEPLQRRSARGVPTLAVAAAHSRLVAGEGGRRVTGRWPPPETRSSAAPPGAPARAAAGVLRGFAEHGLAQMGRDAVRAFGLAPESAKQFARVASGRRGASPGRRPAAGACRAGRRGALERGGSPARPGRSVSPSARCSRSTGTIGTQAHWPSVRAPGQGRWPGRLPDRSRWSTRSLRSRGPTRGSSRTRVVTYVTYEQAPGRLVDFCRGTRRRRESRSPVRRSSSAMSLARGSLLGEAARLAGGS